MAAEARLQKMGGSLIDPHKIMLKDKLAFVFGAPAQAARQPRREGLRPATRSACWASWSRRRSRLRASLALAASCLNNPWRAAGVPCSCRRGQRGADQLLGGALALHLLLVLDGQRRGALHPE